LSDISIDGAGIFLSEPLAVESKVKFLVINRQLNLNLGGIARVVYCQKDNVRKDYYHAGLEFIEVDRAQLKSILMKAR